MDHDGPVAVPGPSSLPALPRDRQRRRKKRFSRDLEDQNESLESPSSVPDRLPLHDLGEDKDNVSPDGSTGLIQGGERNSRSRERARRPKRRSSRTENGEYYHDVEPHTAHQMHSLQLPEKRRNKRPPPGPRHPRRSASAEVINRLEEEEMDGENISPTRRRNRRRRAHGSRDFIDGEEMEEYMVDGEHTKRPKPHKHKAKKISRQQNQATSGEEENYNADVDGEVSMVEYYKVDKEDIVTGDSSPVAPPPNPSISQTLPSQPLDVVFIQSRDGHGFRSERKSRLTQLDDERINTSPIDIGREQTTAEFAVSVHKAFRSFALFCHGLLAGFALCQCLFVYSLSSHGNTLFLTYYSKMAQPIQSLYYMLFALCTVSVFDRYDMANPRSGFFHGLLTRPSRILSISAYLFALVFSISVANIDDRISLFLNQNNLWGSDEADSLLDTWRIINLMRVLGAALGWVLVSLQPTKDYTAQNLYEGNQFGSEKKNGHQRHPIGDNYNAA